MSFKAFLKKCLMEYFIITSCVTVAIGILGMTLDPTARFGYESYFSPVIFGFLSLAPSLVTYSRKELSFRQMMIRKILYIILLEVTLILFGLWTGILLSLSDMTFFALAVIIVYLTVNLISWQFNLKEANEINKTLKSFQGRN